jgi:obg-like ATPase 1
MGIVGLPNVGKSTLFNVLTNMQTAAANYPFCTIEPSTSRCEVPDERFEFLCSHYNPVSKVPAFLTVTDIAGLVKGASANEGLGNAFLSHIRAVDGIYQVVRIFEDEEIIHVEGEVDPVRDLEIIREELLLKDIEGLEKSITGLVKPAQRDKALKAELDFLENLLVTIRDEKKNVRSIDWKNSEIEYLNDQQLLTAKPTVYLVNMAEKDFIKKRSKWIPLIMNWVKENNPGSPVIPFCGALESAAGAIEDPLERKAFWTESKTVSSIPKIVKTGYHSLDLVHFFTSGEDEVRCWTIRLGTKAPEAAGTIHTDFQKGFICAEVMAYADFVACGSENEVKAAGKYKQQGKNYVVQDGDIIFFKANTVGLTKKK